VPEPRRKWLISGFSDIGSPRSARLIRSDEIRPPKVGLAQARSNEVLQGALSGHHWCQEPRPAVVAVLSAALTSLVAPAGTGDDATNTNGGHA